MSKTSIDFFSRGLQDHKTKLFVKQLDFDITEHLKQSLLKTRTSLSSINYNRFDKKHKKQQIHSQEQEQKISQHDKIKIFNSTHTSRVSTSFSSAKPQSLIKRSNIQFQTSIKSTDNQKKTQTHHQDSIHKFKLLKNNSAMKHAQYQNLNKLKLKQCGRISLVPFAKITQECQFHEQSCNQSNDYDKLLVGKDAVIQKNNITQKQKRDSNMSQTSRNYYFIRNLVLDPNVGESAVVDGEGLQKKGLFNKYQPIPANLRYLQPIRASSTSANKKQEYQRYSLKVNRQNFHSLHQNSSLNRRSQIYQNNALNFNINTGQIVNKNASKSNSNSKAKANSNSNKNLNKCVNKYLNNEVDIESQYNFLKNESIKIKLKTRQSKLSKMSPEHCLAPKQKLRKKNIKQVEYGIDRWQYFKDDNYGLQI